MSGWMIRQTTKRLYNFLPPRIKSCHSLVVLFHSPCLLRILRPNDIAVLEVRDAVGWIAVALVGLFVGKRVPKPATFTVFVESSTFLIPPLTDLAVDFMWFDVSQAKCDGTTISPCAVIVALPASIRCFVYAWFYCAFKG